jgi:hypothetical protein
MYLIPAPGKSSNKETWESRLIRNNKNRLGFRQKSSS